MFHLLVIANFARNKLIPFTLMMEAIHSSYTSVFTRPHGVTSQKRAFFVVTAVKNLKLYIILTGRFL
jgi:hypothetical protein